MMKRIISIILLLALSLACSLALASCDDSSEETPVTSAAIDQIDVINAMFETTLPKQSVTTTTQEFGGVKLTSVATLTIGTIDGRPAASFVNESQKLADLDGGNLANLVVTQTEKKWYVEGKGLIKNSGGSYVEDPDGELDFRPKAGDIKLSLDASKLETATYDSETETLVATLTKENATTLLRRYLMEDQKIDSGLTVTITTAGGKITVVKLEFQAQAKDIYLDENDDSSVVSVSETKITVEARYSYDLVELTLE